MKKMITYLRAAALLLAMLFSLGADAQLSCSMHFNPFTRPFTYLVGGNRLADVETDDGFKSIPLGFTFRMGDCVKGKSSYTTVTISSNGWIKLGAASNSYPKPSDRAVFPGVWPFYTNLNGTGGTVSYVIQTLPAGTKVLIVEWRNFKWGPNATDPSISFQAYLYEGSDLVEFAYKQESGAVSTDVDTKPSMIGLGLKAPPTMPPFGPCFDHVMLKSTEILTPSASTTMAIDGSYGNNITDRPLTDQVFQFFQPCCGKPDAGFISQPDSVCPGLPFTVKLSGATPSPFLNFGIKYKWEAAPSATGPWGSAATGWEGSTVTSLTFPSGITTDTFFRVIVTCDSSGMSDTTVIHHVKMIVLPYNCYCYSSAANNPLDDGLVNIGNVTITNKAKEELVNVGTATPALINPGPYRDYSLFTGLRPIAEVNRDSTYTLSVSGITKDTFAFPSSGVGLYIDFDGNGTYHPTAELAAFSVISGTSTKFTTTFKVPSTAKLEDVLGMRVIMKKGASTPGQLAPCNGFPQGETEDYLIRVVNPKCYGPLSAGTSYITDTSICPGYKTTIWNIGHARNMTGMNWLWEYSLDNVNWAGLAGSTSKDTLTPVVMQSTYYRVRMICEITKDTIYSNKVYIKLKKPYKCYCYSQATGNDGNDIDTTDITTVQLDKFEMNTGGPHLLNPESIRMRTDHTDLSAIELTMEDTYPISVYQTLNGSNHGNAKVTVFMDFNHNMMYDAPAERVWTKITSATDYFVHGTITIPAKVIPDVETGMRVIVNSNVGASTASDNGCGPYVSGETEDYLVIFRKRSTSIGDVTNVDNLQIYPNPNNGAFTVSFNAAQTVNEALLTVTTITGQVVYTERYSNVSGGFSKNVNLGAQASGVYFVTLSTDGQKTITKVVVR